MGQTDTEPAVPARVSSDWGQGAADHHCCQQSAAPPRARAGAERHWEEAERFNPALLSEPGAVGESDPVRIASSKVTGLARANPG